MKKREIIIFASVGLIAVVIAVVVVWPRGSGSTVELTPDFASSRSPGILAAMASSSHLLPVTIAPVPAGARAPSAGSATTSAGIAVPTTQVAAVPGSPNSYRSFAIKITNDAYTPSTVIVNQGDTVNLEITAVDGNYAFTQPNYGFNAAIKEGSTQRIQFQALQSGKFTFYCGSCGGPSKGPVGYLVVVAQ